MLLMATFVTCVACCRISMFSISEVLMSPVLAGRYSVYATAFIYTILSRPEHPPITLVLNKLIISGIKPRTQAPVGRYSVPATADSRTILSPPEPPLY